MKKNSIETAPQGTYCSGCAACISVCPKEAIQLVLNTAGFYEAKIDQKNCIDCGKCRSVCLRFDKVQGTTLYEADHFAMQSTDKNVVKSCSSGGLAHELSTWAIENNYTVVGCIYDKEIGKACHVSVNNKKDLDRLKGSKYLQSNASNAFIEVIKNSKKDKNHHYMVLGTPCQIAGMARASQMAGVREQLILVEIFCHGVSSYHLWDKQLEKIEKKLDGKPENVQFRYKKDEWHSYCMKAEKDGKVWYGQREKEEFWHVYFENVLLNDACMVCEARKENSLADIRLGDYWGPRFEQHTDGISGVFPLTSVGKEVIQQLYQKGRVKKFTAGDASEMLDAQNMKGYERDEKHNFAMQQLAQGEEISSIISRYRKKQSSKQKIKRIMLWMSGYIPDGIRIKLKKKRSSRNMRKAMKE